MYLMIIFRQVRRMKQPLFYLPNLLSTWHLFDSDIKKYFLQEIEALFKQCHVFVLATHEGSPQHPLFSILFPMENQSLLIASPSRQLIQRFVFDMLVASCRPFELKDLPGSVSAQEETRSPTVTKEAPARELTRAEIDLIQNHDEMVLRELRMELRELTHYLRRLKESKDFRTPVDMESFDDYLEYVQDPIDLLTILQKVIFLSPVVRRHGV